MWSMADELTFLDHIGIWANGKTPLTVSMKLHLLQGYRTGLSHRTLWTNLNQQELEAYVQREIARVTGLQSESIYI